MLWRGEPLSEQVVFGQCAALVYVLDAQDEPYQDTLMRLVDVVARAHAINPSICFEVFIHKVDGDLFLSDEHKIDCHRDIQQRIAHELRDAQLDHVVRPSLPPTHPTTHLPLH